MPTSPTVIHVLPHLRRVGNGIVNVTVDLALAQSKEGMTVHVVAPAGELGNALRDGGVTTHDLPAPGRGVGRTMKIIGALRGILSTVDADIVHAHTTTLTLLTRAALSISRSPRPPLVATAHNQFDARTRLLRTASAVIAVSESNGETLRRWFGSRRVTVIRNGISPTTSASTVELRRPAVLFVGGLNDRKGVADLLDAWSSVIRSIGPTATLYIVGDGPDRQKYEHLADALDLGQTVRFVGFSPSPQSYMRSADLFVLPSHREPFGLVLAEARIAGLPIISTNVDGIPEVLEHGRAGIMLPVADVPALTQALHWLITDPESRARLAHSAADNTGWLGVERMTSETHELYERLLVRK
nr:glycosyltransferase family 4 protein [uncultured Modestobacter sp.]